MNRAEINMATGSDANIKNSIIEFTIVVYLIPNHTFENLVAPLRMKINPRAVT